MVKTIINKLNYEITFKNIFYINLNKINIKDIRTGNLKNYIELKKWK